MRNIILILAILTTTQSAFAGSTDYPKLPMSVQEELNYLWFHEMLFQADILKNLNSIEEWDQYKECLDNFVAVFEVVYHSFCNFSFRGVEKNALGKNV